MIDDSDYCPHGEDLMFLERQLAMLDVYPYDPDEADRRRSELVALERKIIDQAEAWSEGSQDYYS